ncbi:MAG TPA: GntR family transcriptional regulator, partial [Fimbriimonadaceae bacterium]|nr:GntR family transcriptional regulator [Fimbriimonadaceae bacterium]
MAAKPSKVVTPGSKNSRTRARITNADGSSAKVSDVLAREIRNLILGKRLQANTPLPSESEWIAQTGYSRATVREALRLLESDGLISIKRGPGGGIRVSHPDVGHATRTLGIMLALSNATLRDLFEVRKLLEAKAAEVAATAATAEQREKLLEVSEAKSFETEVDFHRLLAECTGNDLFSLILASLH